MASPGGVSVSDPIANRQQVSYTIERRKPAADPVTMTMGFLPKFRI